ncbi:lecithin retinol acyltransferase family protein [endosymbiont GvMRE of Glomus versiforme]|uniref:lecithin retinol acyltransferase family protein n=1 Tax=endosymbiont GvMRE of Glomus versiforme TaxID=2039283 RepID=UPI000EBD2B2A|nr:lecithin retinol acyltransferase family protein [endosymbiont GvMRE of Glomus versiforme]RHZ35257.1 RND efflux system outer membrane lipoprotein [endosymbiont GvMRE of Glomus versiforme]
MTTCKANSCSTSTDYSWKDYCSYHEKCLDKLKKHHSISNIREVETFETWFNKNCGYVINCNSSSSYPYYIWIVVFEPSVKSMSEKLSAIKYKSDHSNLSSARDKAKYLKNKLQNSNGWYDAPMLDIHPKTNSYERFDSIITSPYVIKRDVPQKWEIRYGPFLAPGQLDVKVPVDNISDYAKVFDVLKVSSVSYEHVGVYVGDGEVCHFSKDRNGTYIDSWEDFKKFDGFDGNIDSSEAVVYHSMIPFKYLRRIAEQIVWAVDNNFWHNNYDLRNRNCEHFANMLVYGINYSGQIEQKKKNAYGLS